MHSRAYLSIFIILSASLSAMESDKWYDKPNEWLSERRREGSSLLELKQLFVQAPAFIKGTVEHLKDPQYYKPDGAPEYRCLMLYGEPGCGKSTLAKAIAMYADWDLEFTTPADYQVGERGEAARNLRSRINDIIARNAPTVLVIDEINQLLENSESKNHDNDATSKELWTTMDRLHGNDKFFLVGTANRLNKIPKQLKSRIKPFMCKLTIPQDINKRLSIFKDVLSRQKLTLSSHGEETMRQQLKEHPTWSGRDFASISFTVKQKLNDESPSYDFKKPIDGSILLKAAQAENKVDEDLEYDEDNDLNDEERQDLFQSQNMHLQVGMQRFQKNGLMGIRAPGLSDSISSHLLESLMTKRQRQLSMKSFDTNFLDHSHYL